MLRASLRRDLLVLAAYALAAAAATYPLIAHPTALVPAGGDTWIYYWDLWWAKRSTIDHLQNPFVTRELYFPYGASLYFHTLNLLPSVLAAPLCAAVGFAASYNALVLASFVLSGYAAYRLALSEMDARGVGGSAPSVAAAFVGGSAFMLSSYRMGRLFGHLDLLFTHWLPCGALVMLRLRRDRRWSIVVLGGLCLAATALTAWYYVVCLLLLAVLVATSALGRRGDGGAAITGLSAAFVVFAVLLSPILFQMLTHGAVEGRTPNPSADAVRFSPDLLAFVVPPFFHTAWGRQVAAFYGRFDDGRAGVEGIAFLGYVPLALAIWALAARRKALRFWTAVVVMFAVLALGPVLKVGGHAVAGVSRLMPYRAILALPYGDIPRVPARFVAVCTMGVAVLAAFGAQRMFERLSAGRAIGAAAALTGLIAAESWVAPLPTQSPSAPLFYSQLAARPPHGGVLEIPIPDDPQRYPRRMLWQTVHQHPVFGGSLSRGLPPLPFDAIPGFAQLKTPAPLDDLIEYAPESIAELGRAILSAYGTELVVIQKELIGRSDLHAAEQSAADLLGPAARRHDDRDVQVYEVPAASAAAPAIWLDRGWSYLERAGGSTRPDERKWRWIADRAYLGLIAPAATNARLEFVAHSFNRERHVRLSIRDVICGNLAIAPSVSRFSVGCEIPKGLSTVAIESLEPAEQAGADPRRLSVAFHSIRLSVDQP